MKRNFGCGLIFRTSAVFCFLWASGVQGLDSDLPWPYPEPEPVSSVFGDPNLTPDQSPPRWDEEQVQASVNIGNPFRDYGHWRLSNDVYKSPWVIGRTGDGPTEWTSAEASAWASQWDATQDWQGGELLKYTLLRPPADAEEPEGGWPLVVVNPGSGGVGGSGGPVTRWGSPYYREHYPAYVLNLHPQERTMDYLPESVFTLPAFDAQFDLLDALLADPELNINERRIYVGGFSMGGSTTWLMLLERPHFFAAASPVSSRPLHTFEEAELLMHLPIWMTTGHDDGGDGSSNYLRAYQHLQEAGAQQIRFWEVQYTGHTGTAERLFHLPEWLFAQERPENLAPEPAAQITTTGGLTLAFDGSASVDPDGTITRYEWDFGDGNGVEEAEATHSYASAGDYMASLRVRDDNNHFVRRYYGVQVTADSLVVNEPMVAGRINIETPYNTEYEFTEALFASAATDPEGDPLAAVRIETLPGKGKLLLDGTELGAGDVIAASELDNLGYLPTGNEGLDRFEYTVSDGFFWSPESRKVEIKIGPPPPSALFTNLWTASSGEILTSTISIGAQYFSDDEGPVITELPDFLDGAENIRTTSSRTLTNGISDKDQSGPETWIRFDMEEDATVYVAYDSRNTGIPEWLADWELISSDEVKSWIYYELYAKDFSAGSTVELGTNKAAPASGSGNGYFIMGVPTGSPEPGPEVDLPQVALTMQAEGNFRLEWEGEEGYQYILRSGTDFSNPASWPIVHQEAGVEGPMIFEAEASSEPRRFWLIEIQ